MASAKNSITELFSELGFANTSCGFAEFKNRVFPVGKNEQFVWFIKRDRFPSTMDIIYTCTHGHCESDFLARMKIWIYVIFSCRVMRWEEDAGKKCFCIERENGRSHWWPSFTGLMQGQGKFSISWQFSALRFFISSFNLYRSSSCSHVVRALVKICTKLNIVIRFSRKTWWVIKRNESLLMLDKYWSLLFNLRVNLITLLCFTRTTCSMWKSHNMYCTSSYPLSSVSAVTFFITSSWDYDTVKTKYDMKTHLPLKGRKKPGYFQENIIWNSTKMQMQFIYVFLIL